MLEIFFFSTDNFTSTKKLQKTSKSLLNQPTRIEKKKKLPISPVKYNHNSNTNCMKGFYSQPVPAKEVLLLPAICMQSRSSSCITLPERGFVDRPPPRLAGAAAAPSNNKWRLRTIVGLHSSSCMYVFFYIFTDTSFFFFFLLQEATTAVTAEWGAL